MKPNVCRYVLLAACALLIAAWTAACGQKPANEPAQASAPAPEESGDKPSGGDAEPAPAPRKWRIGITQIIEHPALDSTREGFIQAFVAAGYEQGVHVDFDIQSAQGDMNTNKLIAQKFVQDKVDLVYAISTPSAQSVVGETSDIPVVFGAVTDPIGAGLVGSLESPGKNVTGTSDNHPDAIKVLLDTIRAFLSDAKTVGVIYNTGEQNSVEQVRQGKAHLESLGIRLVEATVTNTSEVKQAAESLVGKVDAVYVPTDSTAVAAIDSIVAVAGAAKIPFFASDTDSVAAGAFAGYGIDYTLLGRQAGEIALQILRDGKKPAEIPVQYPTELQLTINEQAAADQGVDLAKLPQEYLSNALRVKP